MTKSSKKLTAFGMALIVAILIGGFLLHPWGRTKSELTVTKVDLSNNSIYATAVSYTHLDSGLLFSSIIAKQF